MAIPKNELRVNNWVETMSPDRPYLQIKYGEQIDYCAVYNNPILLTPEFFEKAGFTTQREYSQANGLRRICNGIQGFDYRDNEPIIIYNEGKRITKISYVHQFQNYYQILTGEELQITL